MHFITTSPFVRLSQAPDRMYQVVCKSPCPAVISFGKQDIRPFVAADEVFQRGYASAGEYEVVTVRVRNDQTT